MSKDVIDYDLMIHNMEITRYKKNLFVAFGVFVALIFGFWTLGEFVSGLIIALEIAWVSVSTIGSGVIALGLYISVKMIGSSADKAIDAYISILRKKSEKAD